MTERSVIPLTDDQEKREIVERVAALEHEQWAHWTAYMLDNLTPENIARWKRQIDTPYDRLTEQEKESDRRWAQKHLDATDHFDLRKAAESVCKETRIWLPRTESSTWVWKELTDALTALKAALKGGRRE